MAGKWLSLISGPVHDRNNALFLKKKADIWSAFCVCQTGGLVQYVQGTMDISLPTLSDTDSIASFRMNSRPQISTWASLDSR